MDKGLSKRYCLLFKTGDAELKALENLWAGKDYIFPIVELTRGRKSSKDKIGEIRKRIDKLKYIFNGKDLCLDITTATDLMNEEIQAMYKPKDGYNSWVKFLLDLDKQNIFKSIIPTIIIDTDDKDLKDNLRHEVEKLCNNFSHIAYRNDIADDGCYEDIEMIRDIIVTSKVEFYFIIDCEYITPGSWDTYADKVSIRIEKIRALLNGARFIIVSTSFPKYVTDVSSDDSDTFRLNEIDLFNRVLQSINPEGIHYGDYGSINPIRNDLVIMSRGWVPRIDVPLRGEIFFHKMKRGKREYSETYIELARDYVIVDPRLPKKLNNWGISQINICANGDSPGSRPSFWISVRMNIHIEQQLRRLKLL